MATALDVSKYILKLSSPDCGDYISNLKLQKLLYYAQGAHLGLHGTPLFETSIQAWEHGPVVPEIYNYYKDDQPKAIPIDPDFHCYESSITAEQTKLLDEIYEVFGQFSAWKLREMTQGEAPWKSTFDPDHCSREIPLDLIQSYFQNHLVTGSEQE